MYNILSLSTTFFSMSLFPAELVLLLCNGVDSHVEALHEPVCVYFIQLSFYLTGAFFFALFAIALNVIFTACPTRIAAYNYVEL